jgi:cytochrome c oxidase subunit 2
VLVGARRSRSRVAVRAVGLGVVGTALVTLLSGCLRDVGEAFNGFGWPRGITDQSDRMYDMWVGSVVAAIVVGLVVWGLIFWCVVRYRKRTEDLPPQTRFHLPMEVLYTVTPFLVIAVLFYQTAIIQTEVGDVPSTPPDEVVEVVGFTWNWQFNYRDGVGEDANTVASTTGTSDQVPVLVLPTGRTVRFELASQDVIHSFWVPELLFKRDVIPGNVRNEFEVTIKVDEEGSYVGRCAELCGIYHSMMTFELRAVSPEVYDRYLPALQSGMSTPEALRSIGQEPFATTTRPHDTRRTQG